MMKRAINFNYIKMQLRTHVLNKYYLKKVLQEVKHTPMKRVERIARKKAF